MLHYSMFRCFGNCKQKKSPTPAPAPIPNLPPCVIRHIGTFLNQRNLAALAVTSKASRTAVSRNLKRRRIQTLVRAAGKLYAPRTHNNYTFYQDVLRGIKNLKNTQNKRNTNVTRRLTNANLNALRRKVLQNMHPLTNNTFRNEGINFIWRLKNNTHLYGMARLINGRLPYEAFDIFVYKRQPNGTYARYNTGGYLNRRTAPGHGGRRVP